jgi:hypothetical protein
MAIEIRIIKKEEEKGEKEKTSKSLGALLVVTWICVLISSCCFGVAFASFAVGCGLFFALTGFMLLLFSLLCCFS